MHQARVIEIQRIAPKSATKNIIQAASFVGVKLQNGNVLTSLQLSWTGHRSTRRVLETVLQQSWQMLCEHHERTLNTTDASSNAGTDACSDFRSFGYHIEHLELLDCFGGLLLFRSLATFGMPPAIYLAPQHCSIYTPEMW